MSTKGLILEQSHFEIGLAPVADALAGTVRSDIVNMRNHNRVRFIVFKGAGATGTSTLTVEASDDVTPSNVTAIPFHYRRTATAGDPGAITAATTAGFATTAAAAETYEIEVLAEDVRATGYQYVSLKAVEVANDPVLAGILIELLDPIFANNEQSELT